MPATHWAAVAARVPESGSTVPISTGEPLAGALDDPPDDAADTVGALDDPPDDVADAVGALDDPPDAVGALDDPPAEDLLELHPAIVSRAIQIAAT
jgi:hypothetical protein